VKSSGNGEVVADMEDTSGELDAPRAELLFTGLDGGTDFIETNRLWGSVGFVKAIHG